MVHDISLALSSRENHSDVIRYAVVTGEALLPSACAREYRTGKAGVKTQGKVHGENKTRPARLRACRDNPCYAVVTVGLSTP